MILFKKAAALSNYLEEQRAKAVQIGFVPTMGALHRGHISLVEEALRRPGLCVCSIFVNPTQFNDPADFEKYPVTLEKDLRMLESAGCDILFLPSITEIYPGGTAAEAPHYDLGYLETILEGKYRPGHFQGVCRVVHRLLEIVHPNRLHLGQKDYQQCMVIRKMIGLLGMAPETSVEVSPTLREEDGLAMSSRNMRLNTAERRLAPAIYQCLLFLQENLNNGDLLQIKKQALARLQEKGFKVDYVELADADSLQPVADWDGQQPLVALIAAFLNDVRLIDNILLTAPKT